MQNNTNSIWSVWKGITLVEVMTIIALLGLIAGVVVPNLARARNTARKNACVENLRLLKIGQDSYAREYALPTGTVLSDEVVRSLKMNKKNCPAGGTYSINPIDKDPTCSYPEHTLPKKIIKDP